MNDTDIMSKQQTIHSYADSEVTIRVPHELRQHAQHIANEQGETLSELMCLALSSYISAYSAQLHPASQSMSLETAKQHMQIFGQGLGEGTAPHDAARRHDDYLYRK